MRRQMRVSREFGSPYYSSEPITVYLNGEEVENWTEFDDCGWVEARVSCLSLDSDFIQRHRGFVTWRVGTRLIEDGRIVYTSGGRP